MCLTMHKVHFGMQRFFCNVYVFNFTHLFFRDICVLIHNEKTFPHRGIHSCCLLEFRMCMILFFTFIFSIRLELVVKYGMKNDYLIFFPASFIKRPVTFPAFDISLFIIDLIFLCTWVIFGLLLIRLSIHTPKP